jgi:hypothetical protein
MLLCFLDLVRSRTRIDVNGGFSIQEAEVTNVIFFAVEAEIL